MTLQDKRSRKRLNDKLSIKNICEVLRKEWFMWFVHVERVSEGSCVEVMRECEWKAMSRPIQKITEQAEERCPQSKGINKRGSRGLTA